MKAAVKHIFRFLPLMLLSASCVSEGNDMPKDDQETQSDITITRQGRYAAEGIDTEADEEEGLIITSTFQTGDLLYFSQMGPASDPNFNNQSENASPYLYIYEYRPNPDATWAENYNFKCQSNRQPLEWETVKSIGSVGNSFQLYAMYFPGENQVRFNVETDQRGPEGDRYNTSNFIKSDVMGAYHATSSLYTRLRFRLFHLMTYLRVTLYVPEYQDENTDAGAKYSGFQEGALKGAFVLNACTGMNIEWRANRSSDTDAPLTQPNTSSRQTITMYEHDGGGTEVIEGFQVENYYPQNQPDFIFTDNVREYNFSVLFPAQPFADNFLCFVLENVEGTKKYYYFSANQIVGATGENLSMTQGTLQQLYLYLPRTENETILVRAKILPWQDAVTDMTVVKQQ